MSGNQNKRIGIGRLEDSITIFYLKSSISMKYDITKQTAPKMPRLGKGTECVKILLSQVSKNMHAPLIPMLFPILGAHVSGSEYQYSGLI